MPYLGQQKPITSEYTAVQRFNGDGSDTTFTLTTAVSSGRCRVVDGVVKTLQRTPFLMARPRHLLRPQWHWQYFVNYLAPQGFNNHTCCREQGQLQGWWPVRTNAQSLTADTTILATENANVTGPFTVASGVTLTVESGGTLVTL
ncbi:MAG: hypothetical protein CM15mV148_040 [uncultured marine virus]|nr:MAG: hypothetical protein CM15mV148_040 [uncultured marine virus]